MAVIDTSTDLGKRLAERLRTEQLIWFTSTSRDGTPQPNPIWFLWNEGDDHILMLAQPTSARIANIRRNPHVSLNFNSDDTGGDIGVMAGTAEILADSSAVDHIPAYVEKYGSGIEATGMTPESIAAEYSQPIRIDIARVRGF